jgi:hypothetical protein
MPPRQEAKQAEEHDHQHHGQGDETVAGHALFVAQRAQALDVAGGQVVDQLRIGGGRAAKMALDPFHPFPQIEFARARFVVVPRGGEGFGNVFELFLVHALEHGIAVGRAVGGAGGGRGPGRIGGGTKAPGVFRLDPLAQALDPGLQLGDPGGQSARPFRNGIRFFFEESHAIR